MLVWGLWLDGAFYFSTGRKSRKACNLAENSYCVIATDRPMKPSSWKVSPRRWQSVRFAAAS